MPNAKLQHEIDALRSRIKEVDEELREYRENLRQRAAKGEPIYDELARAGRLEKLLNQRRALLEGLERLEEGK